MCTRPPDAAHRAKVSVDHTFLAALAEHEEAGDWRRDGAANFSAWLARRYQESYATARR